MARRATINKIRSHRTYTVRQAADCVGVTIQTIRRWRGEGLRVMTAGRPFLILGDDLKTFVKSKRAPSQGPIPPGAFRCLTCKRTGPPAVDVLDYKPLSLGHGMLIGFCGGCEGIVTRIVSLRDLPTWEETFAIGNGTQTQA